MMKFIEKIDNYFAKIEIVILVILLISMVLLAFAQIILRNFFASGFLWADVVLRHLVLWITFISASLSVKYDKHINIDVFSKILPKNFIRFSKILTNLFSCVICFLLSFASVKFVRSESIAGETLALGISTWIFQIIIPIGFILIGIRFLFESIKGGHTVLRKEK